MYREWFHRLMGTNQEVIIAFWIAVATIALTLIMLTLIIGMRLWVLRQERHRMRVIAKWRKVFSQAEQQPVRDLPDLPDADVAGFIEAWNEVHEPLAGQTRPHLEAIGHRVNLKQAAAKRLRGTFHERASAIVAMGHLHLPDLFETLEPFLADKSAIVSLCAARALAQLDTPRAMAMFVPKIIERDDWVQGSVARILKEGDEATAARALSSAILRANDQMAPKLVRFLAGVNPQEAAPVIRQLLTSEVDDHLTSTCLQVVSDPQDVDLVRGLLTHPRWHVRMQAAAALGRLGGAGDDARLQPLLSDAEWWVRYRAAQAIAALPAVGRAGLKRMQGGIDDRYARDIIDHVLAETALEAAA